MLNEFNHMGTLFFSAHEVYLFIGKNHRDYLRWIKNIILKNPCLTEGSDYVHIDNMDRIPGRKGRKAKHTLISKQTAIAICIMSRTVLAQKLKSHIEGHS